MPLIISRYTWIMLITLLLAACATTRESSQTDTKMVSAAKINDRLGMAYLERNDIQRAKQKFILALDEAPHIPETWYSMAYFMESTGNKEEAKKYYLKAIEVAPGRGDALNNYGTYLCRAGDYRGAVNYFVKATQDPKYLQAASAYENAGICALKIPSEQDAKKYFTKALAEDPQRPASLIELAELNYKQGDYKLSRQQLDQHLQLASPSMKSYMLEKKLDQKLPA
ncbi:Photosystem I assembly protein Ycf3 [Aquicella siphonis]|uniref:Photosystem I assembly protein Ycf3 n=1 Tax=Aquicella siphonis TaxID=254247 RepID=A0A5E4PKJ7_9COXI|nr:type IV pilus biogenesis/stability protein PilW [Aquicella siphonis]VVC77068.1 Photosystem I assembly protein Ycf3 [Aquicella siphonis]